MVHHTKIGQTLLFAVLSSTLLATAANADPAPDAILLERIGAVRMVQPDEIRQPPASEERQPHQTSR